jgi:3-phenylpropionate/trans-cinnamate dioxygenase ferredoxin subunit
MEHEPVTVAVGRADELRPGSVRVVDVDGRAVAVFNVDGCHRAIDDACPHHGASLSWGRQQGGVVRCPLHDWAFEVASGRCYDAPVHVATHPCEVRDGIVHVTVPTTR